MEGKQVRFEDIKRVHVVKYQNYLEQQVTKQRKPLAPNSINRKISSVSSFYQFLLQRDVVEKNPVEFCKQPAGINVRDTEAFNDAEMKEFFSTSYEESTAPSQSCFVAAFYYRNA